VADAALSRPGHPQARVRTRPIRYRRVANSALLYGATFLLGMVFFLPFLWLVSSSLKTDVQIFVHPPQWIPNPWMWSNYPRALEFAPFADYAVNSLRIALFSALGAAVSSALVAYGFARIQWPGRDLFFFVTLTTLMIPFQVTMVPMFLLFKWLGIAGTPWALIVPYWFGNAYYIFLLRQFLMTIPGELSEAARIDGASELGIFGRIVMPLAKPALAVVALFQFMHAWGDYLGPLIFLRNEEQFTIALGLQRFLGGHMTEWGYLMAASTMATVPIILLFFFTQRTFIEGISLTGIKG
jgi:multiple sugar transport system permease protein